MNCWCPKCSTVGLGSFRFIELYKMFYLCPYSYVNIYTFAKSRGSANLKSYIVLQRGSPAGLKASLQDSSSPLTLSVYFIRISFFFCFQKEIGEKRFCCLSLSLLFTQMFLYQLISTIFLPTDLKVAMEYH